MTEQAENQYDEDEISLLDILVTLAESWKLLVFGPLIAAILAGGLSFLWPKSYESVAILRMTEEELALLHSAPVLDPLIEKLGLLDQFNGSGENARKELKKRLVFSVDKKTRLATFIANSNSPDVAQEMGNLAIATLVKELQIKGQEKVFIEKTININNRAIALSEDMMDSIQLSIKKGLLAGQTNETLLNNFAAIHEDIIKRSQENEALIYKLAPKGVEVFVQAPSLPQYSVAPKHSLLIFVAIMFTAFALLIFVFIRRYARVLSRDVLVAKKISIIKSSLGIKSA